MRRMCCFVVFIAALIQPIFAELSSMAMQKIGELKNSIQENSIYKQINISASDTQGLFESKEIEEMFWFNVKMNNVKCALTWSSNPTKARILFDKYWQGKKAEDIVAPPLGLFECREDLDMFWHYVECNEWDFAKDFASNEELAKKYVAEYQRMEAKTLKRASLNSFEQTRATYLAKKLCELPRKNDLQPATEPVHYDLTDKRDSNSTPRHLQSIKSPYYSTSSPEIEYVNGYFRSNGKYISGHFKTRANGDLADNWSSKGNANPFTGKKGYKKH